MASNASSDRLIEAEDTAFSMSVWFIDGNVCHDHRPDDPDLAWFTPSDGWACIAGLRIDRLLIAPLGADAETLMFLDEPTDAFEDVPPGDWNRIGIDARTMKRTVVAVLVSDDRPLRDAYRDILNASLS